MHAMIFTYWLADATAVAMHCILSAVAAMPCLMMLYLALQPAMLYGNSKSVLSTCY